MEPACKLILEILWYKDEDKLFLPAKRYGRWATAADSTREDLSTVNAAKFLVKMEAGLLVPMAAYTIYVLPPSNAAASLLAAAEPGIPEPYQDLAEVFSKDAAWKLSKYEPHDHAIKLEGGQPPWGPVYNLSTNKLQVLRGYIDDNLAKDFIHLLTLPAGAPVLFVPKKLEGLHLFVNCRGLNKVTIKNR